MIEDKKEDVWKEININLRDDEQKKTTVNDELKENKIKMNINLSFIRIF